MESGSARSTGARVPSEEANRFADDWIAAWNRRDLDEILALYAEDATQVPCSTGRAVRGRDSLREHIHRMLAENPDLRYQLYRVAIGSDGLVLIHRGLEGRLAAEVLTLDGDGRILRAVSHLAVG